MKNVLVCLLFVFLSAWTQTAQAEMPTWLPQTWGIHTYSYHFDGEQPSGSKGWNNNNLGIYARYDNGITGGTFKNSLFKQSWYLGYTFSNLLGPVDITIGVVTGYDKMVPNGTGHRKTMRCESACRVVEVKDVVLPMVVPSVALPITDSMGARAAFVWSPGQPAAVHLSFETRF